MPKDESRSIERDFAARYVLRLLGDVVTLRLFEGDVSDVEVVEMKKRPPFTQFVNGRPFFDEALVPGRIFTTREEKSRDSDLIKRLNLVRVSSKRRQDLGGIIKETLETREEGREWMGAGLDLLAETLTTINAGSDTPSGTYLRRNARTIIFPGALVSGRSGTHVLSVGIGAKGAETGFLTFQNDYDVRSEEWLVARGSDIRKTRKLKNKRFEESQEVFTPPVE